MRKSVQLTFALILGPEPDEPPAPSPPPPPAPVVPVLPGFACVRCGSVEQSVVSTRKRPGLKRRIVRCECCGHHFRTRETVESVACPPPKPRKCHP